MMIVDPFKARALAPVSRSYIGSTAAAFTATNPQSITGVPIGTAAIDRFVFEFVHWGNGSPGVALLSAAIGGVTAKVHGSAGPVAAVAGTTIGCALISALVPAGTTATVDLTFGSGSGQQVWLETYSVNGLVSDTPIDTIVASALSVQPYSGAIDVQKDGLLLFGASNYSDATSYTVSGATQDYQIAINSPRFAFGASLAVTANEINRAVGASRVGGVGSTFNAAVVAASFR